MKNLFKMFAALMLILGLQGCYTMIWSPEMEFPNAQNSYNYYESYYFYDYDNYYNYPWWLRISPPSYGNVVEDRNDDQQNLRSGDGGRPSGGRTEILLPAPPGRPGGNPGGPTTPPQGDGDNSKRESSDSGRDSNIRNNDSERNSDKGRR